MKESEEQKGGEVGLDWKLVARYSGLRCRRRCIYTKSVEDRELAVGGEVERVVQPQARGQIEPY